MGGDGGAEAMQALSLLAQLAASGANVGESEWYRSAGPGTGTGGGEAGGRERIKSRRWSQALKVSSTFPASSCGVRAGCCWCLPA